MINITHTQEFGHGDCSYRLSVDEDGVQKDKQSYRRIEEMQDALFLFLNHLFEHRKEFSLKHEIITKHPKGTTSEESGTDAEPS